MFNDTFLTLRHLSILQQQCLTLELIVSTLPSNLYNSSYMKRVKLAYKRYFEILYFNIQIQHKYNRNKILANLTKVSL